MFLLLFRLIGSRSGIIGSRVGAIKQ